MRISYKQFHKLETSIRQSISNKLVDNSISYEKEPFSEVEGVLNNYLESSNREFNEDLKQNYKDSIFNITCLLQKTEVPEYYAPFETFKLFNNLLEVFVQCAIIQEENQRELYADEKSILIESTKLLIILSYRHDCCSYLDNIGFFEVIDRFIISSYCKKKFSHSPQICKDYSYNLIKALANFSRFEEYNVKIKTSMIKYVLAGLEQTYDPEYYKEPLLFLKNYFAHYIPVDQLIQEDQVKSLLGQVIIDIGSFPCSENIERKDLIPSIHYDSSFLIYILAKLQFLKEKEFFEYRVDKFLKEHYLSYEFLMLAIGYIASNHPSIFERLEFSLDDICEGLDKENEFLHYTYVTIYYVLCSNQKMLNSDIILRIVDFIVNMFDKYDYLSKYYSFILLCYIYTNRSSIYMENISAVFLLLDNCGLFISENDEINNEILRFLNVFHSFLEASGQIDEYMNLASAFNNCMEIIISNIEYFDQSLMCNLTRFQIEK